MRNLRATPNGALDNQVKAKSGMQQLRATEAGGTKHRIDERNRMQSTRDDAKTVHDEKIAKIPFPLEFPPEKKHI